VRSTTILYYSIMKLRRASTPPCPRPLAQAPPRCPPPLPPPGNIAPLPAHLAIAPTTPQRRQRAMPPPRVPHQHHDHCHIPRRRGHVVEPSSLASPPTRPTRYPDALSPPRPSRSQEPPACSPPRHRLHWLGPRPPGIPPTGQVLIPRAE
jgi:hypothetical protein